MSKNRSFQMLAVIALVGIALAGTISAVNPVNISRADLSWPPRPDFSVLNQKGIIPFSGDQGYAPRQSELKLGTNLAADMSDYALRHTVLGKSGNAADASDYFLRHSK
jgi:hypothetical protein